MTPTERNVPNHDAHRTPTPCTSTRPRRSTIVSPISLDPDDPRREAGPARQRLGVPGRGPLGVRRRPRGAADRPWYRAHHADERCVEPRCARPALLANEVQRFLLETRLGIPAIVHEEICSGLMAREATVFAQAIGVASTFRPEHNHAIADAIRRQMRAIGAHQGLSPVLDVCRDPRWGRLEETYGEDPYLVSQMGLAFIRGLQGDDLADGAVGHRHRQALRRLRRVGGWH